MTTPQCTDPDPNFCSDRDCPVHGRDAVERLDGPIGDLSPAPEVDVERLDTFKPQPY